MTRRRARGAIAIVLAATVIFGTFVAVRLAQSIARTNVTAYFDNSNGIFVGDQVRILGVAVGKIDAIEAQPHEVKVSFWVSDKYQIPANVKAAILSPSLVTARAIQLTPAYNGGPSLPSGAVIPRDRTVVPIEWDDFREQLKKLTQSLQPTQPGGVSTLGAFINTAADNLRGQGTTIRDSIIKLSQAFSVLGDHSGDIFSTVKNLSILVSALHDSADLMARLNQNLAAVTTVLTESPGEIATAVKDLNSAVGDVRGFVGENRDSLGTTVDKLAAVTNILSESLDDIKQTLHITPTAFQDFVNIYQPAQASVTGVLAANMFSNPITFLCGAIQAASRLGAEQSAKLCVQYLAPIIKNRQYNFPPIGLNPIIGTQARPNEITYSEDWLRPGANAPQPTNAGAPPPADRLPSDTPPGDASTPAPEPTAINPADGLQGLLVPKQQGP